jgi:hypothetical protein
LAVRRLDREERTGFWGHALTNAKQNEIIGFREDVRLDWRTELDRRFLSFLSRASRHGADEARRLYQAEIDPFVQSRSLLIPLIPPLHQLENPRTAWAQMLANLIGQKCVDVDRDSVLEARVTDHRLRLYRGKQEISSLDLRRSATSLRVLQIIAGQRGREISKQKLHEALTGTRYSSKLHDQRLQKLFKRLEREITAVVGESLWCWPGTNSLRLLRNIAYES